MGLVLGATDTSFSAPPVPVSSQTQIGPSGAVQQWIPLITGDRVAVDAKDRVISVRSAKGREGVPIRVEEMDGHTYALPTDAQKLVDSGRIDRRLFDITSLKDPSNLQQENLRLIVMYKGGHRAAEKEMRAAVGVDTVRYFPELNADAITAPRNGGSKLWDSLTNGSGPSSDRTSAPGVASVWLDNVVHTTLDVSVPQIGAPEAWQAGFDGTGARIAVLDTGVDTTHPDLAGQVIASQNFTDSADTEDHMGHGTHVASIAAGTGKMSDGKYKGVAPGAKILNGKVINDADIGLESTVIAGMEWAVAQNADVANLSLSFPDEPGINPLEAAVNKLSAESNTLFVVAAGNTGGLTNASAVNSPGSADAALTVGAVDKSDHFADFSSTGPRLGDDVIKPDLTAPGVDIAAAKAADSSMPSTPIADGYVALSGTSMATPHVVGAAAILAEQHPDWTGTEIKNALVASSAPGSGYTPFQQGTGRVDLRTAIKQTVVTDETSLSFSLQQWPHTDDDPITKELTYHNLSSVPVTLKLATTVTGPDGHPAPSGFLTVDDEITVLPRSHRSVHVTVDTRLGGDVNGYYTGYVTATSDGQSVRTSTGVNREVESYTVTVKPLDREGRPAQFWTTDLNGVSGPAESHFFNLSDDTNSVRVPKGRYVLNSTVTASAEGAGRGTDWFNQPDLEVTQDVTVPVDARITKPIDIAVPDRTTHPSYAAIDAFTRTPAGSQVGFGFVGTSFEGFRTAHLGPAVDPEELTEFVSADFSTGATGSAEYHLLFHPTGNMFLTGYTRHLKIDELAKINIQLGAAAKETVGAVNPWTSEGSFVGTKHALPYTGAVYLYAPTDVWHLSFAQYDAAGNFQDSYEAPQREFGQGLHYTHSFNIGVFGPDLPEGTGLIRADDTIAGQVPLLADNVGNVNAYGSPYDEAETTLYRNGQKIGSSSRPMDVNFPVGPEPGEYLLSTSVKRRSFADVSTAVVTEWTFPSEHAADIMVLPTSVVRFTPALDLDNTGKAGVKEWVPVTVKGTAAGMNLKSLAVQVSYDKGAHWVQRTVHHGQVTVTNPGAGRSVSFKAIATDKQDNTVSETIYDAYLTK